MERLFGEGPAPGQALESEPGLHNVIGMERSFANSDATMNFLLENTPFYGIKGLSTKIYRRLMDPFLDSRPGSATALDAGCGIGRFTIELAERFSKVVALDASPSSLRACRENLDQRHLQNVDLHWADLTALDQCPAGVFDVVLGMEVICYTAKPEESLARLTRVAKPGGLIIISVEGRPGSFCAQGAGSLTAFHEALNGEPVIETNDRFVIYLTAGQLGEMFRKTGLKPLTIEGSHYFGEGPFWQNIDDRRLSEPEYTEKILQLEAECRNDPVLAPWARVFSAVGIKA